MITPYHMPEVVRKWKNKEIKVTRFVLYEIRPNGERVYICSYFFRDTAREGKATMENHFPWKNYAIVGGEIKCE